jgi:type II secretion system protein N
MSEKLRQNLLLIGAYASFFWFAFALFAYFTFPYDRLRDYLTDKVADGFTLEIGELSPSWVTGVTLEDVNLTRAATEPDAKPVTLHLDSLTLRVAPFSLLSGAENISGSLAATLDEGELQASLSQSDGVRHVEAELDALDMHGLGLGAWWGIPLKGDATGTIDLTLDPEPSKTAGNVELKIDGLRIADGKTKVKPPGMMAGLTLNEINAGTLDTKITVEGGTATLERLTTDGPDLKAKGNGTVTLAQPIGRSRIDILLDFSLTDAWKTKDAKNGALVDLLTQQGEWRRATDPDGTMHLHVGGTVQALRAAPGTPSRVRSAGRRGSKRPAKEAPAEAPEEK